MERDDRDDVREQDREAEREHLDPRSPTWLVPGRDLDLGNAWQPEPLPYDWPPCLEQRALQDVELLSKLNGLKRDVWAKATPEERLETLREAERQLAQLQGREPFRTYAVDLPRFVEGEAGRIKADPVYCGSTTAWGDFAEGRYIRLSQSLIRSEYVEYAVEVFAHEVFHAFQFGVIWAAEKKGEKAESRTGVSRIDAEVVDAWRECNGRPRDPDALIEQHAEHYAMRVSESLYPGYWSRASGT